MLGLVGPRQSSRKLRTHSRGPWGGATQQGAVRNGPGQVGQAEGCQPAAQSAGPGLEWSLGGHLNLHHNSHTWEVSVAQSVVLHLGPEPLLSQIRKWTGEHDKSGDLGPCFLVG